MMLRKLRMTAAALTMAFAGVALAGGAPKSIEVKVETDGKYDVEAYRFGSAELVGFLGDVKDEKGVQAVVWVGKGASSEREADLAKLAARAGMKAFFKESGKLRELDTKPGAK
jgi:hypothetical protein